MKLYSREKSGNCYKVRLLLSFLDLKAEEIEIATSKGEHKSERYLAINPRGQIPCLQDGEETFVDSSSILLYLAARYGEGTGFWSKDPIEQARIVEWMAFVSSWFESGLAKARVLLSFRRADYSDDPIVKYALNEAQVKGKTSLGILETHLKDREWLVSSRLTIAGELESDPSSLSLAVVYY